jgi:exodeoxyribonuclease-5
LVFEGPLSESTPAETERDDERIAIKGGRERGLVVHKLLEEVLTSEIEEDAGTLENRARKLLSELGIPEAKCAEDGPYSPEIADSVRRGLLIPVVAALRPRLMAEVTVYAADPAGKVMTFVGGVVDALAINEDMKIDVVVDWKSDIAPSAAIIDLYREQVRDYLSVTGGTEGLLVFVTTGRIEHVPPR